MKREDYITCITRMLEVLDETELRWVFVFVRTLRVGGCNEN